MFKNTFQSGFLSILYSIGSKPLQIWDKKVRNGHIKRITDNDIQSLVLEIVGTNVSTTFISCPADPKKTLGIKLPFLVMIIKNLKKYFTFEVQVIFPYFFFFSPYTQKINLLFKNYSQPLKIKLNAPIPLQLLQLKALPHRAWSAGCNISNLPDCAFRTLSL